MGNSLRTQEAILNDAFNTWFNARHQELISSELLSKTCHPVPCAVRNSTHVAPFFKNTTSIRSIIW